VSITEIVRRAIKAYRFQLEAESRPDRDSLLEQTKGIWKDGDGLAYQQKLRSEWNENSRAFSGIRSF
jgi:hypothetical protein